MATALVAVTDGDRFEMLRRQPNLGEVDFGHRRWGTAVLPKGGDCLAPHTSFPQFGSGGEWTERLGGTLGLEGLPSGFSTLWRSAYPLGA